MTAPGPEIVAEIVLINVRKPLLRGRKRRARELHGGLLGLGLGLGLGRGRRVPASERFVIRRRDVAVVIVVIIVIKLFVIIFVRLDYFIAFKYLAAGSDAYKEPSVIQSP